LLLKYVTLIITYKQINRLQRNNCTYKYVYCTKRTAVYCLYKTSIPIQNDDTLRNNIEDKWKPIISLIYKIEDVHSMQT